MKNSCLPLQENGEAIWQGALIAMQKQSTLAMGNVLELMVFCMLLANPINARLASGLIAATAPLGQKEQEKLINLTYLFLQNSAKDFDYGNQNNKIYSLA